MTSKVILVTGGNRGIGLGIVQSLAQRSSENTIIVASREEKDAEQAISDLQASGLTSPTYPVTLDVTDDGSIKAAVEEIAQKFGKLDVLINNAGIALLEEDLSDFRSIWNQVLNTNVVSVRIVSELFLPLLRKSEEPRIINISSLRGSFHRVTRGRNPPVASSPYSTSKAALNMMMLGMVANHPDIAFYAVSPGHCKTAFNGYRGTKDPLYGGTAAAELSLAEKGKWKPGFWESEENGMEEVGW